jgi:poly-gamma-glutamate capsule biosynthesis protein CapA/YwtB (metallophosphatase superfamily)
MSKRGEKLAQAIDSFVENPVTNLVKGVALLLIGVSDASHTFRNDITHGHVRVGHGLIIIGVFAILGALPHFIESLEAGARYLELRAKKDQGKGEADNG